MNTRKLQLAGIIAYAVLAIIFIYGVLSTGYHEDSIYVLLIAIVIFQFGIVFIILNYFKPNKENYYQVFQAMCLRILGIFPMFFMLAFNDSGSDMAYYIFYGEIIGKVSLAIYNTIVARIVYKQT